MLPPVTLSAGAGAPARCLAAARAGTYGQGEPLKQHARGRGAGQQHARGALVVRASELNQWADTGARDEDHAAMGFNEDDLHFHRETSDLVLKVLTMRAAQKVLAQLTESNLVKHRWLAEFCEHRSPLLGDEFVAALFNEKSCTVRDSYTGREDFISPSEIGARMLVVRSSLGSVLATPGFNSFVSRANVGLMRSHLEAHTYTSGSLGDTKKASRKPRRKSEPAPAPRIDESTASFLSSIESSYRAPSHE